MTSYLILDTQTCVIITRTHGKYSQYNDKSVDKFTLMLLPGYNNFPIIDHPVALCKQNGTIFALSDNDDGINPIKMMEPPLCQLHISIVTTPYLSLLSSPPYSISLHCQFSTVK